MTERSDEQPALSDDLLEQILARSNLQRAWEQVRANRGAPGIDQMTLEDFPAWAQAHWAEVKEALWQGRYRPRVCQNVNQVCPI